jgi:hypothetical protein
MYINNSGNVGIGTTSPGKRLEVRPGSSGDGVLIANGGYQTFGSNATLYLSGGVNNNGDFAGFAIASEQTSAAQHVLKFCRATANADNTNFAVSTEYARIDSSGRLLVGTSSQSGGSLLQVNDNRIRIATAKTPASATDTGVAGEICWDANYVYVCTATNTWKRTAISTW